MVENSGGSTRVEVGLRLRLFHQIPLNFIKLHQIKLSLIELELGLAEKN